MGMIANSFIDTSLVSVVFDIILISFIFDILLAGGDIPPTYGLLLHLGFQFV